MMDLQRNQSRETAELAIEEAAKWVDRCVWALSITGLTLILAKIAGLSEFPFNGVKFNIGFAWLPMAILTVAHAYATILLLRALRGYWSGSTAEDRLNMWNRTVASGGILIRGAVARTRVEESVFVRYKMSPRDPSAWLALLGMPVIVAAVTPFSHTHLAVGLVAGLALAQANWVIASHWLIAFSDLAVESEYSNYFKRTSGVGIRAIQYGSGGYIFEKMHPVLFLMWAVPNTALLMMYAFTGLLIIKLRRRSIKASNDRRSRPDATADN